MPAGQLADVAIGIQTAKGTPASSSDRFYLAGGGMPAPIKPVQASPATLTQPLPLEAYAEAARAGGSVEAWARPAWLGVILYAILGAKAVSGSADPWTHTFTAAATQPWLTLYRGLGGVWTERFVDCKVASVSIVSRAGAPVLVVAEFAGISPRFRSSAVATTVETGLPFLHQHGRGALQVEGAAVGAIDDIELTLARETGFQDRLTGVHVRGGARLEVTARVGQVATDRALWNRWLYGTSSPADDTAAGVATTELAGSPAGLRFLWTLQSSPARSLQLDLPRVVVGSIAGPDRAGDVAVRQDVTYRALKPAGQGVTLTLRNARSAY